MVSLDLASQKAAKGVSGVRCHLGTFVRGVSFLASVGSVLRASLPGPKGRRRARPLAGQRTMLPYLGATPCHAMAHWHERAAAAHGLLLSWGLSHGHGTICRRTTYIAALIHRLHTVYRAPPNQTMQCKVNSHSLPKCQTVRD